MITPRKKGIDNVDFIKNLILFSDTKQNVRWRLCITPMQVKCVALILTKLRIFYDNLFLIF
jgi:hypothetical protein